MEIVSTRSLASRSGCEAIDDAAVQAERDRPVVAQLPDSPVRIPSPTGLLHLGPNRHLGKGDA